MLPAKQEPQKFHASAGHSIDVRPGSWWRLADPDHPFHEMPAHDHGLILMVEEVRVIDGEIHTIILHPHPAWGARRPNSGLKIIYDEFVASFRLEELGDALREVEIADVMGTVQAISAEMRTPPDPAILLERKKEKETEGKASASNKDVLSKPRADQVENLPSAASTVPVALLPSQDIVEAQQVVEGRIAAFEAQKDWITAKTKDLTDHMALVSAFHMEKVSLSLASISEETTRAKGLLQNVQTMRLFLGEDMAVTPILKGQSADPSEPLTFMQRMLFLDEEIIINDLLEGFSSEDMTAENLSDLFSKDFSLVERMLPYRRCAAIVRIRRNERSFDAAGMSIGEIFQMIELNEADRRVHILVRDGENLNIITADATTSGALRFFPSSEEINALFQTRSYHSHESKEILPDQVEYSDARAEHDQRALFYKRFLILLWGMHERTDVFGPFMDKGTNWLAATTHSERFRFIHDEEAVLTDGRPTIIEYVQAANRKIMAGSRVVANWRNVVDGSNAPSLAESSDYQRKWLAGVDLAENVSIDLAQRNKASLFLRAPAVKTHYNRADRAFSAKVTIVTPKKLRDNRPDLITDREIAEGLLCLDHCTLEDVRYYMNSRAARQSYLAHAHIFNKAHATLAAERKMENDLLVTVQPEGDVIDPEAFTAALRLWRSGNKWVWPQTDAQLKSFKKLIDRFGDLEDIHSLLEGQERLVRGGIKANGDVFALCDTAQRSLPCGAPLPWLEERIISNTVTGKIKKTSLRTWHENDEAGETTIYNWGHMEQQFKKRCAPPVEAKIWNGRKNETQLVDGWAVSRGLFDASNASRLDTICDSSCVSDIGPLILGQRNEDLEEWLREVRYNYKAPNGNVQLGALRQSVALVHAWDNTNNMPAAWVIDVEINVYPLAYSLGLVDDVKAHAGLIYANAARVVERIANAGSGINLVAKRLHSGMPLADAWNEHLCLSFDDEQSFIDTQHSMPKSDPKIGWKQAFARRTFEPDAQIGEGWQGYKVYSADALVKAAENVHVIAPTGGMDLLQLCFDKSEATGA